MKITGAVAGLEIEAPLITGQEQLQEIIDQILTIEPDRLALDIETTGWAGQQDYGPQDGTIRLVQMAWDGRAVVIDAHQVDLAVLRPVLEGPAQKVLHYSPFERAWFRHHLGLEIANVIDTCYLGQSINKALRAQVEANPTCEVPITGWTVEERATLKAMALRYLGADIDKAGQTSDWSGALSEEQLLYAAGDAVVTLALEPLVTSAAKQIGVYERMLRRVSYDEKGR